MDLPATVQAAMGHAAAAGCRVRVTRTTTGGAAPWRHVEVAGGVTPEVAVVLTLAGFREAAGGAWAWQDHAEPPRVTLAGPLRIYSADGVLLQTVEP